MISRGKAQKQAARSAPLSAALRENLKRRKAQVRRRGGSRADGEDGPASAIPTGPETPDFRRNRGRD